MHVRYRWFFLLLLLSLSARGESGPESAAQTLEPPSGPAASIKALLAEARHPRLKWSRLTDVRQPLEAFYLARHYAPIWVSDQGVTRRAIEIIAALAGASASGLDPADFDAERLAQWPETLRAGADGAEQAAFDVAMSVAVARYAGSLHHGRVLPRSGDFSLRAGAGRRLDIAAWLAGLAAGDDPVEPMFAALEPRSRLYRRLKEALAELRVAGPRSIDRRLTLNEKLAPGDQSPEVPKLRLILSGNDAATTSGETPRDDPHYDPSLVEAVKRFQRRHGLEPDGVVGKATVERLRLTDEQRLIQLRLAMERQRWLPDLPSGRHLVVNVPAFQLAAYDNGLDTAPPGLSMRVIVGQAKDGRRTPLFAADMTYLVFRPHWNLPYKIATKEMLPGAFRNAGYLARRNIELVSSYGSAATYPPTAANLHRVSVGALRLRQKPGPKNALGLVKFAFPNQDAVYLHSTPNQNLFARARRDFSHGCVRVADPVALAEWVLRPDPGWTRERILDAMNGDNPRTVVLTQPLPVYLMYSTVGTDDQGDLVYHEDIYGHDAALQTRWGEGFDEGV